MTVTHSIAKNVAMQYVSRVIGTAFGLATLAILTRYLGAAGYGQFTVATSYLQFIGTLVDFGLTITAIQMLSEPDADQGKVLGNLLTLRIITAVAVFAAAIGVAFFLPWGSLTHMAIAIGSFSFILLSIHQIFVGLFQKNLRMEFPAISEVVGRGVLVAAVALVAARGGNLIMVMAAMSAANLAMLGFSLVFARKVRPFSLRLDRAVIAKIYRRSWPIAISIMFNLIYLRGDVIVMKIVGRPEAEIGWYGAAYKPLDVITVIPIIFMGLVLPLFVHAWSTMNHDKVRRIIQRAVDAVGILAWPTLAGGLVLSTPLMIFISGPQFAPSGPLLALLIIAAFMVFYGSLFGHLIVGINRQRVMTWIYAADAFVSLALYFIFIPRYGATAAALVTIFSEAVIAISASTIVLMAVKMRPSLAVTGKALLSACLMGLIVYIIPGVHVLIRILIGVIVYGILLVALRAVTTKEIKELTNRTA
jgi:O-antigen/teichoic acid export membrane protein